MSGARSAFDVAVVGAGAAGLMCAIEAGRRGRSVVVLEHNNAIGKKILISGGGRCNFTNLYASPENYFSQNPDFCRSALSAFNPEQFIAMVERHAIPYHEKKLGQLFCDGSAREIVDMLQRECDEAGVEIRLHCSVNSVARQDPFEIGTDTDILRCESLVVASGGLSIPQLGASGFGYDVAARFGLERVEVRPGLVPLTFSGAERAFFAGLSGVSLEARVSCGAEAFTENVLFTHRGLSGPAILQISSCWPPGRPIVVDLSPRVEMAPVLFSARGKNVELVTVLSDHLPKRFAQAWCATFGRSRPMERYSIPELERVAQRLHEWELRPAGTAGYAKAEVTVGGVDTTELRSRTLESRKVPGLFFIGEVVDVTGWLGGYNFQWAWASGYAAGQVA